MSIHIHEHEHEHEHNHEHDGHGHSHPTGFRGFLYGLFVPHSHDASDSIDNALEASTAGVRALKISTDSSNTASGKRLSVLSLVICVSGEKRWP